MFTERGTSVLFLSMWMLLGAVGGAGNNASSPSSSRPSIVNIGALFTYDSAIGRSAHPAIHAAIDDVNSNPDLLPGTKLNLVICDTNCSAFLGTVEGIIQDQVIAFCCFSSILSVSGIQDDSGLREDFKLQFLVS